jgi:hypothetical protein
MTVSGRTAVAPGVTPLCVVAWVTQRPPVRSAGLEPRQSRRVQTRHGRTDCRRLAIRQRHDRLLAGYRQMDHETDANVSLRQSAGFKPAQGCAAERGR